MLDKIFEITWNIRFWQTFQWVWAPFSAPSFSQPSLLPFQNEPNRFSEDCPVHCTSRGERCEGFTLQGSRGLVVGKVGWGWCPPMRYGWGIFCFFFWRIGWLIVHGNQGEQTFVDEEENHLNQTFMTLGSSRWFQASFLFFWWSNILGPETSGEVSYWIFMFHHGRNFHHHDGFNSGD